MANFPTLKTLPTFPLSPDGEIEDAVLRSPAEAGYQHTRARFTRVRRSWCVSYPAIDGSDQAALATFETTTLGGGAGSFSWVHPVSGTSYTVRFTAPLKFAYITRGLWAVAFTLHEV